MKLKIQSLKNYFKSKKDRGLKPIFFEKIGDSNTSREQRLKNLIKVLESQGFKIKNKRVNF
tara:strand:+ start:304 stop:486 length:183 start_codon:yes stop_codon:yes gene_type:complete